MTDLINGSPSVSSVIDRDSAAGLRSVVKQRITVSVNSWQSWGQPCVSVLAEAPKGTRVVVWFGSGTQAVTGQPRRYRGPHLSLCWLLLLHHGTLAPSVHSFITLCEAQNMSNKSKRWLLLAY